MRQLILLSACVVLWGCRAVPDVEDVQTEPYTGNVPIVDSWAGDYPVSELGLLPEGQRPSTVGYIADADTFDAVWAAFKPGEGAPGVDFTDNIVVFARNARYYNRMRIVRIAAKDGVVDVFAASTRTAQPIQDKMAMALAVIPRTGLTALKTPGGNIDLPKPEL